MLIDTLNIVENKLNYEFFLNDKLVSQCKKENLDSAKKHRVLSWKNLNRPECKLVVYLNGEAIGSYHGGQVYEVI